MANTVNDVMNVIASPDYGIRNIAGTNQEILAILSGVHNSPNNIHTIVNDVKNLLQTLVESSSKKVKPIEVGNKSSKINNKNIENILDETKGIRKAINTLEKAIIKQSGQNIGVAKLSDKASEKVADAMVKNIEKEKKGGGMAAIADAFTKLKNISLKDIILGKLKLKQLTKVFKKAEEDLNIKEKDIEPIIKLINSAPEMVESLLKINRKVNKIVKNNTIQKLSDILVGTTSILTISESLQKNKETIEDGAKSAENIKKIISHLNKAVMKLIFAALFAKVAEFGVKSLDALIEKIIPLATKLEKNKQTIEDGEKAAKQISTLVGKLLLSTIYLTLAVVFVLPAMLGAFLLKILVENLIIPLATTLSNNHQQMKNASKSALTITTFTGLMLVTTLFLTVIAKNGLEAILGAAILIGIVYLCDIAFQTLSTNQQKIYDGALALLAMSGALIVFGLSLSVVVSSTKDVTFEQVGVIALLTVLFGVAVGILGSIMETALKGSLVLAVMGLSLLIFTPALERICKATKEVTFEQVEVIATMIGTLALEVAALGLLALPMIAGSGVLSMLSSALIPFSISLEKICAATKDLTEDDINLVNNSMSTLGSGVASMALLTLPIQMGAVAIKSMGIALYPFVSMLKILSEMETVPTDSIDDVLSALDKVSSYFKNNSLSFKTIWAAEDYMYIMPPFVSCVRSLAVLKEMGSGVPITLVRQALNAMDLITNFYNGQDMGFFGAIGNRMVASSIVGITESFTEAVNTIKTLKDIGMIPTALIRSALRAITMITDYYEGQDMGFFGAIANRASASSITSIIESFTEAVNTIKTLKDIGMIPTALIRSALRAITMITDYYNGQDMGFFGAIANRASASSIAGIVESFGEAVSALVTLKEMGRVPIGLVRSALSAIKVIMNFYNGQKLGFFEAIGARISASMITGIVESFTEAVDTLKILKEMGIIPTKAINSTLEAINNITWFYWYMPISYGIDEKCDYIELVVEKFTTMAKKIQDKFNGMKEVDHKSVETLVLACQYITNFYSFSWFFASEEKITNMNFAIETFIESTKKLTTATQGASSTQNNVKTIVTAMEDILTFFKDSSLNIFQSIKANRTLSIFERVATVMAGISNVNTSNITSVGGALTDALSGVDSVDMGQVIAVTNMFNAFNKISKSENIINKFTESVKEFTETCKDLMEAMDNNTTAINNGSSSTSGNSGAFFNITTENNTGFLGVGNNNTPNKSDGIKIKNVDEMAKAIADKINGTLSVDIPDAQIQLLINGSGGNEWTITKC